MAANMYTSGRRKVAPQARSKLNDALLMNAFNPAPPSRSTGEAAYREGDRVIKGLLAMYMANKEEEKRAANDKKAAAAYTDFSKSSQPGQAVAKALAENPQAPMAGVIRQEGLPSASPPPGFEFPVEPGDDPEALRIAEGERAAAHAIDAAGGEAGIDAAHQGNAKSALIQALYGANRGGQAEHIALQDMGRQAELADKEAALRRRLEIETPYKTAEEKRKAVIDRETDRLRIAQRAAAERATAAANRKAKQDLLRQQGLGMQAALNQHTTDLQPPPLNPELEDYARGYEYTDEGGMGADPAQNPTVPIPFSQEPPPKRLTGIPQELADQRLLAAVLDVDPETFKQSLRKKIDAPLEAAAARMKDKSPEQIRAEARAKEEGKGAALYPHQKEMARLKIVAAQIKANKKKELSEPQQSLNRQINAARQHWLSFWDLRGEGDSIIDVIAEKLEKKDADTLRYNQIWNPVTGGQIKTISKSMYGESQEDFNRLQALLHVRRTPMNAAEGEKPATFNYTEMEPGEWYEWSPGNFARYLGPDNPKGMWSSEPIFAKTKRSYAKRSAPPKKAP